jgi:heat shock protein HslJ
MKISKLGFCYTLSYLAFVGLGFSQGVLQEKVWNLTNYMDENGSQRVVTDTNYSIEFKTGGLAAVKADCNGCGATYAASGTSLSITLGMCTRIFCGSASLDNKYLANLAMVKNWESNANSLFLKNSSNKTILTFTKAETIKPLIGGKADDALYQEWTLNRIGLKNQKGPQVNITYILNLNKNGSASHNYDCNNCTSPFAATDVKLKMGQGMCTMMACFEDDPVTPILYAAFEDSADYQLSGNQLWVFFNSKLDTLIYHNKQSTGISIPFGSKEKLGMDWSIALNQGSVLITFPSIQEHYTLSAYNLRGELLVSTIGASQKQALLPYSFQRGVFLIQLEINGQKQIQTVKID